MFPDSSDNDYSNEFAKVRRHLTNSAGVRYVDYVKTLKPNYARVYLDLALGHAALALIVFILCLAESRGVTPFITIPLGAITIGYFGVFIGSFVHEASHWNLAAKRDTNDRLSNIVISWLLALDIKSYRIVHFEHHRSLGTTKDSEFSYFSALNLRFFAERALGLRTITTLMSYARKANRPAGPDATQPAGPKKRTISALLPIAYAAAVNFTIVASLFLSGFMWAAVTWVLGIGIMLPLLGSLRQLLEHRAEDADPGIDYSKQDQGAYTRLFGSDILSSIYGSAGFNRHLLHHWEPQVSYTRLADVEKFLADTQMREIMESRRSSYAGAFARLFSVQ